METTRKWNNLVWALLLILLVFCSLPSINNDSFQLIIRSGVLIFALILTSLNAIRQVKNGNFRKQLPIFLSILLIIIGFSISTFTSKQGSCQLTPNLSLSNFTDSKNRKQPLPFSITVQNLEVLRFPGSESIENVIATLQFSDSSREEISVKEIVKKQHYRFYLTGYQKNGTITLRITHDPWGIGITYSGYLLLLCSLLANLCRQSGRFRQLLSEITHLPTRTTTIFTLILLSCTLTAAGANEKSPQTFSQDDAEKLCEIYIYHNNRICPLQTLAQDFVTTIYGKGRYNGLSAEQLLCSIHFHFEDWKDEPFISINKVTREALGISSRHISLSELMRNHEKLASALDSLTDFGKQRRKLAETEEKINLIMALYSGELFKVYPLADATGNIRWFAPCEPLPDTISQAEKLFITSSLQYAKLLHETDETEQYNTLIEKILIYQKRNSHGGVPTQFQTQSERWLNRIQLERNFVIAFTAIGLLLFGYRIICGVRGKTLRGTIFLTLLSCFSALYIALLFLLRWIVAGRIPLTNGYETMLFLALCFVSTAAILARRRPSIAIFGIVMTGFTLLTATISGRNPAIAPLQPMLDSPLLSIHVTSIMISYALFGFITLNSISALLISRNAQAKEIAEMSVRSQKQSLALLYPALWLLLFGIVCGSVWGNLSWGNYWSWDPKEVWALITALIYLYPLQSQLKEAENAKKFHLYMAFAILAILFTYFGVNQLLGGLHSYA